MMFLEAVAGNAMLLTALHGIALQKFYDARMLLRTFRLDNSVTWNTYTVGRVGRSVIPHYFPLR